MKPVTLYVTKNPESMLLDTDCKAVAPGACLAGLPVKKFVVDADCLITEKDRVWFTEVAAVRSRVPQETPSREHGMPAELGMAYRVNETATQQQYKAFVDSLRNTGPGPIIPAGPAVKLGLPDTNPKSRVGITKPSMNAIPAAALLHLGAAMDDGKKKYGLFNWREHSVACSVYEDAIWRHLLAWRDGEDVARDSGRHHLAHVMACCAILLDAKETNNLIDDRGPAGEAAELIDKWTEKPS